MSILALAAMTTAAGVAAYIFTEWWAATQLRTAIQAESDQWRQEWRGLRDRAETHTLHDVVPVEAGGEVVAHLCVTCDKQLPANFTKPHPAIASRIQHYRAEAAKYDGPRRLADGSGWDA